MIENTIFNDIDEIDNLIEGNYGFICDKIVHKDVGSANCYFLYSGNDRYLMKEFQRKLRAEKLLTEIKICNLLNQNEIPTSEFVVTKSGEYLLSYKEHFLHLQRHINGMTYEMYSLPDNILFDSAALLGKITRTLRPFDNFTESFDDQWLSNWSNENEIKKFQELLKVARSMTGGSHLENIKIDLEYKISILNKMQGWGHKFLGSYKCNSHGDYSLLQLICESEQIAAVVDFASVACLPVTWELIRSYSYGSQECEDGNHIDFYRFKNYIDAYLKVETIPLRDVVMMPYLYYFNLSRSSFGYKQFLTGEISDKKLLKFAFWRTKMCKWLEINKEVFSEFLHKSYVSVLK